MTMLFVRSMQIELADKPLGNGSVDDFKTVRRTETAAAHENRRCP